MIKNQVDFWKHEDYVQNINKECLKYIEETYGLACYIFDEEKARANIQNLREYLKGKVEVAYAMKANPWIVESVLGEAEYIEVCSDGELDICEEYGVPGERIVLDGILKNKAMIEKALRLNVCRISIDSLAQLNMLIDVMSEEQHQEVVLRISCGNQFGMQEEEFLKCVESCKENQSIDIVGIQYYPGTQRREEWQIRKDMEKLIVWVHFCENILDFEMEIIEFGAGIGIPYFKGEKAEDYDLAMQLVSEYVEQLSNKYKIVYEAGRCIAATCGIYITRVFAEKKVNDKTILFCKGGTNQLKYPGGILGVRVPDIQGISEEIVGKKQECMICGSLCSESDVLIRSCSELDSGVTVGDYIIFYNAGAYAATESPNLFLSMEMPAVLLYNKTDIFNYGLRCIRKSLPTCKLIVTGCD